MNRFALFAALASPRIYDSFLSYADLSHDFIGWFVYGRVEHRF